MRLTITNTTFARSWIPALAAALLCGCGLLDSPFDDDDDDASSFDDESTDTDDTPPPPSEGFRVYPKFMLQTVPAIVTIEASDSPGTPIACVLDGAPEGGYVCDADQILGVNATIRVDKDGFDSAVRSAEVLANQIQDLEVHLSVEGGPTGVWSECVGVGEFESCAAVCDNQMLACAVTSCATEQPQWPVATLETFASPECLDTLEVPASGCGDPLPLAEAVVSMRCCCGG